VSGVVSALPLAGDGAGGASSSSPNYHQLSPHDRQGGHTRSSTPSSSFAGVAVPDGFGDPLELEAIEAGRGGASVSDPPNRSSSPSSDIVTICIYTYIHFGCMVQHVHPSADRRAIPHAQPDAYFVPFTGKLGVFTLSLSSLAPS
jgi:hypothetical protein